MYDFLAEKYILNQEKNNIKKLNVGVHRFGVHADFVLLKKIKKGNNKRKRQKIADLVHQKYQDTLKDYKML